MIVRGFWLRYRMRTGLEKLGTYARTSVGGLESFIMSVSIMGASKSDLEQTNIDESAPPCSIS